MEKKSKKIGTWVPVWAKIKRGAREIIISTWCWAEAKVRKR